LFAILREIGRELKSELRGSNNDEPLTSGTYDEGRDSNNDEPLTLGMYHEGRDSNVGRGGC